jgi:Prenyltransferase and squalene oxidase repeat
MKETMKRISFWCLAVLLSQFAAEVRSATPPPLDLRVLDPTTVQAIWPNLAPGFILQESETPNVDGIWNGILQNPVPSGGNLTVTRSLPPDFIRHFFRLRTKGAFPGLDYLVATQNPSGTWGSGGATDHLVTSAALQALSAFYGANNAISSGLSGISSLTVRNNDDLARGILALAGAGQNVDALLTDLLGAQNAEVTTETALGFPGNGWGLGKGFGNSTIDTALGLRAVLQAGLSAGLAVLKEPVPVGGSSPVHQFNVPPGATGMLLKIRSVTGATLRFNLTPPGSAPLFVDIAPRTTTINISPLPNTPGTWAFSVANQGGVAANYTAQIGFTDAAGLDSFRISNGLLYLGLSQNSDGGWGISSGEDSHLMITSEVLQTLSRYSDKFVGPQVLSAGVARLVTYRNADGGFSELPNTSNDNETSLAVIAIRLASPGTSLSSSISFLKSRQLSNGSWGNTPYATALAAQALFLPPVVSPIPDQTVADPSPFATITLDNFVNDPDNADNQISWSATGQSLFAVSIVNRVATITYPPGTRSTETITFTATDPDGFAGSTSASFTVTGVDYTIPRGGSATDSRIVSGAAADIAQINNIRWNSNPLPGVTYSVTSAAGLSATQIKIDSQIGVGAGVTPGIYSFQIDFDFIDAGNNPIPGPFTGDVFNISVQVTP